MVSIRESINPHLPALRKRVGKVPQNPGIYRWLNEQGEVLYVGKAKNLRSRLRSYLQVQDTSVGPWKLSMRRQLSDFDITVTNTELEALVLETNLIKEKKPKYNVLMKDDKNYLYVQISLQDPYPAIGLVRRGIAPGTKGFGPYTGAMDIAQTLDMLHGIFPYRACRKSVEALNRACAKGKNPETVFNRESTPCLEYQIGQCCGLCVGALTQQEYRTAIEQVMKFLRGERAAAIEKLQQRMQKAAQNHQFELAAQLRDTLEAIERLEERQLVSDTSGEDIDIIGMAVMKGHAQALVLRQRDGRIIDEIALPLAGTCDSEEEALAQFLPQFYGTTPDIPPLIVIGRSLEEQEVLDAWLTEKRSSTVKLKRPERGRKAELLALAQKNAQEKLKQLETAWEAAAKKTEGALSELKDILTLEETPKRIEGYDISHLSGTETVGSMVVAKNGKAMSDQYRSFTIRTLKEGEVDDYKALREVLKRRLLHLVHDLKQEEKRWKEKGITFGRARKNEMQTIETTIQEQKLAPDDLQAKDFLVARRGKTIVGFARLYRYKDATKMLKSLWIEEKFRGAKLGQFLCRKLLKREKKGKIYLLTSKDLEEYYGEIGFRYIHEGPPLMEKMFRNLPTKTPCIRMMYDVKEHRNDTSLSTKPDLLVIDGGKGQLSTALAVLKELDLKFPVIGLAKREEEVFVPGNAHPLVFPKDSQAKFLLMRLRNEAHRFANAHREKRLSSSAFRSQLDSVPGIGATLRTKLLTRFGSVTAIKAASDEEIKEILTPKQLKTLREHL
ncbi:hypothetical protein COU80_02105 [Candidatus Peregrinibacteria bacterium CG10_big_fil_rev_8_21_14_0_10_55_24]|nr:MAG: hypothetical protein COU80_02105 [Candidatus Peregrinibacteria bacterium CG10_big_fil_rev_8_21_14_0_10_55_24]